MKSLISLILSFTSVALFAVPAAHQAPGMSPQPALQMHGGGANQPSLMEWQGVPQRTYFLQWSQDLTNWKSFPLTEEGAGLKSFGSFSSTPGLFTRLHYTDETPDMAANPYWHPPLLKVASTWKVLLQNAAGQAAPGVRLSFFYWQAGQQKPNVVAFHHSISAPDGTCSIAPLSIIPTFAAGDRIEVRLSGSPHQRVVLPYLPGSVAGDSAFLGNTGGIHGPGGAPLPISDIPANTEIDAIPIPGSEPPEGLTQPVYRFSDFLTIKRKQINPDYLDSFNHLEIQYPNIATQTLVRESWGANEFCEPNVRLSHDDTLLWSDEFIGDMGLSVYESGHFIGEQIYTETYDLELSVSFSDRLYQRAIKRHILLKHQTYDFNDFSYSEFYPAIKPVNTAFVFKNDAKCLMGSAEIAYDSPWDLHLPADFRYKRELLLGPVPMYVPESVMGGEPFYFSNIDDVLLYAELPLGKVFKAGFAVGEVFEEKENVKIEWKAEVIGTNQVHVEIAASDDQGANHKGAKGVISHVTQPSNYCEIDFSKVGSLTTAMTQNFQVKVSAKAIITKEQNGTQTVQYELGDFTTDFVYQAAPQGTDPTLAFAKRQTAEVRGLGDNIPEGHSLQGGQRGKSLEPERKIGITGKPSPDATSYVDALTGRFHHTESDFSLPIPGSDLSLHVSRQSTDSVWDHASGLRPSENPHLAFGPGWVSSLAASLTRSVAHNPAGAEIPALPADPRRLVSSIVLRDFQGRAYTFFEYINAALSTSFLPDPTLVPSRETSQISLTRSANGTYTFSQPLLGITHVYPPSTTSILVANSRDIPLLGNLQPSGMTRHHFHRLAHVSDRFNTQLNYQYGTSPHSIIPEIISVSGRPGMRLSIRQENGRVSSFWDPDGVKHTYSYVDKSLSGSGSANATQRVLQDHKIGSRIQASYNYRYATENDPRPLVMLSNIVGNSGKYRIPTYHLAPCAITRGNGETTSILYQFSTTRSVWSSSAKQFYNPAGDPMQVDQIILPNSAVVDFTYNHILKAARPASPASTTPPATAIASAPQQLQISTNVTDYHGSQWIYQFGTPRNVSWTLPSADAKHLPKASAIIFPSLTRSCLQVADSAVTFFYDARAGFALSRSTDAANRSNSATFQTPNPSSSSIYGRPLGSGGVPIHSFFPAPTTTTNLLGQTTTYEYPPTTNPLLRFSPATIKDSRGRRIVLARDSLARQTGVTLFDAQNTTIAQLDYAYTNTAFPGALTRSTRKALAVPSDPTWVTDLVTNIHLDSRGFPHRIGNDAAALLQTTTRTASGLILEKTTPSGATTSFAYDNTALLTSSTLADGTTYHYRHDAAGRLAMTKDPLGNATGYTYDPLGRLTTHVRDMNGDLTLQPNSSFTGIQPLDDIVQSYQYLDATRTIRHTDPRGYISEQQLDPLGRIAKLLQPAPERDPGTLPTLASDHVTHYEYDLLQSPQEPVKITDPRGFATHFRFDNFARLETILTEYGTENNVKLHHSLTYSFSPITGLPERVTTYRSPSLANGDLQDPFADTLTQSIDYDALDRPRLSTFATGTDKEIVTRSSYTSTGLPYRTELRQDNTATPSWNAYLTEYDALARPVKQTLPTVTDSLTNLPAQPTTTIHYNAAGHIQSTANTYGHHTEFGYDTLGRLSWEKLPSIIDARSGQSAQPTTIYHYDARGLLTKTIDPLGYAWQTQYDAAGRPATTTSPILRPEFPAATQRAITHFRYDAASNLTKLIDANGHTTTHTYHPDNSRATTTQLVSAPAHTSTLIPHTSSFHYNPFGQLTKLIDPAGQATSYTYDGLGRPTSTTRDSQDPLRKKTTTTSYDALLPTATIDPANLQRKYIYDAQLRLSQLHIIGRSQENLSFTHDPFGRLTHIQPITPPSDLTLGNPAIARTFDALGRLSSETSNSITTAYGYDLLHQLTHTKTSAAPTSSNNSPLTLHHSLFLYDPAGRKTSSTTSYPLLTAHSPLTTAYQHNLRGEIIHQDFPNGHRQTNTIDPAGRITAQTLRAYQATAHLTRSEYQYDHLANLTNLRETFAPNLNIPTRTLSNAYNQLSQLTHETQQETGGPLAANTTRTRSEIHTYDLAENRLSTHIHQTDPTSGTSALARIFTYGNATNGHNANQLHTLTETTTSNNSPLTTHHSLFHYDANGNRKTKTANGFTDHYTYDSFHRLTKLELNTAAPTENATYHYRYDALTRRISRSIGNTATAANSNQFAFSGRSPIHQWQGNATAPSLTQYRSAHHHTTAVGQAAQTTQDATNVRHDITSQFTSSGALQWHGQYASNGMLNRQYGIRSSTYGANGKYEEPAGLLNEGHRYRDRTTNTFITRDPLGFIDGPNDYNYVRHNPWSAWDPLGLATTIIAPSDSDDIGYVNTTQHIDNSLQNGQDYLDVVSDSDFTRMDLSNLPIHEQFYAETEIPPIDHSLDGSLSIWANAVDKYQLSQTVSNMYKAGLQHTQDYKIINESLKQKRHGDHNRQILGSTASGLYEIAGLFPGTWITRIFKPVRYLNRVPHFSPPVVKIGGSVFPKGYQGGPGAMWTNEGRGLWNLTTEGADKVMNHDRFGTFYKSSSDGLWWAVDNAGHGGSAFKVFEESGKGLKWLSDADQFGDFIIGKHKGATGQFIPWKELKGR